MTSEEVARKILKAVRASVWDEQLGVVTAILEEVRGELLLEEYREMARKHPDLRAYYSEKIRSLQERAA